MDSQRIRFLHNPVRKYAWGSRTAIPELLGQPSPAPEPQAELWMGAHPSAPSRIVTDAGEVPLDAWIARDAALLLGSTVANRYAGELPFLFKVLAVEQPLSIQAHPGVEQARVGFAREEAAGIPRNAEHRSYKDAKQKPELLCALTTFHALDRFREIPEIVEALEVLAAPEIAGLLDRLRRRSDRDGLAELGQALLE